MTTEISEKEIEAARAVLERRIYDEGGCETEQVPAMVREMLEAAARVRAEAAAETLIDTVSEEVWNHDASQDNCNVIDKDDLTNTGEPVAWGVFYRGKIVAVSLHKSPHYSVPLYTRPAEQAVTDEMVDYPRILYVCEHCQENAPEMCGRSRDDIYVTPSGEWLCDECRGEEGVPISDCVSPPALYPASTVARLQEQLAAQIDGHQLTAKEATANLLRANRIEAGLEEIWRQDDEQPVLFSMGVYRT